MVISVSYLLAELFTFWRFNRFFFTTRRWQCFVSTKARNSLSFWTRV